jgi:hypothetical protein
VKFIRGTKETSVEVEVAPQPPTGWTLPSPAAAAPEQSTVTADPTEIGVGTGHSYNK